MVHNCNLRLLSGITRVLPEVTLVLMYFAVLELLLLCLSHAEGVLEGIICS